jgi:agmatinase
MGENLQHLTQNLLVPPGMGVYTVHTAKERKDKLHHKLYGTSDTALVVDEWLKRQQFFFQSDLSSLAFFAIPSDCGGGILRGANWGPLALRSNFYDSVQTPDFVTKIHDLGDVRVIPHYLHDSLLSERAISASRQALFGKTTSTWPVSPLSIAEYYLQNLYENKPNLKIFGLGGDHSVSYPLVKTYLQARKRMGVKAALIHFDAHTDLLPSRLGVDICFGSWTYHILEHLNSPADLYQIGIRASGKDRDHWEKTHGIHQHWCQEVRQDPIGLATKILSDLQKKKIHEVYVTFDIDALDISHASATGTPEGNGLFLYDAAVFLRTLAAGISIGGADLVEVAPFIHHPESPRPEPYNTIFNGTEIMLILMESMLGRN